jgi:hypothetical protein
MRTKRRGSHSTHMRCWRKKELHCIGDEKRAGAAQ